MNNIFSIALSGLQANQTGLKNHAQNVANANTLGYKRVDTHYASVSYGDQPAGVKALSVTPQYPWIDDQLDSGIQNYQTQKILGDTMKQVQGVVMSWDWNQASSDIAQAAAVLGIQPDEPASQQALQQATQGFWLTVDSITDFVAGVRARVQQALETTEKLAQSAQQNQPQWPQTSQLQGQVRGYQDSLTWLDSWQQDWNQQINDLATEFNSLAGGAVVTSDGTRFTVQSDQTTAPDSLITIPGAVGDTMGQILSRVGSESRSQDAAVAMASLNQTMAMEQFQNAHGVDLATQAVAIRQTETAYEANLAVIRTADRMMGSLLNLFA